MKVYIVHVHFGGDDGDAIDGVYAAESAAAARAALIEAAEAEFWPEFDRQNPGQVAGRRIGCVDNSRWNYLGDTGKYTGGIVKVTISEYEVIET